MAHRPLPTNVNVEEVSSVDKVTLDELDEEVLKIDLDADECAKIEKSLKTYLLRTVLYLVVLPHFIGAPVLATFSKVTPDFCTVT